MSNPFKIIAIGLVPTLNFTDWLFCIKCLFLPRSWKQDQKCINKLESDLSDRFENACVNITDNGRTALYLLLKALDLNPEDEVMTQAFTCVAVPLAIQASGAKVVWVDASDNFNIDLEDLKRKITPHTKVIIVQHTFGIVGEIEKIKAICHGQNIFLIEDCAHSFGITFKEKKLGLWGDATVLSFGRDKVITGISGGATITNDHKIHQKIIELSNNLPKRSSFFVWKTMLNAVVDYIVLHTYKIFSLGKVIHWLYKNLKLEVKVLTSSEKSNQPELYRGLGIANCKLIARQLFRLEIMRQKKNDLTSLYSQAFDLPYLGQSLLSTPLIVDNPGELRTEMKKEGVFLGNWYDRPIAPSSVEPSDFSYEPGSCPQAEYLSSHIVNLPTMPSLSRSQANMIIELINKYEHSSN